MTSTTTRWKWIGMGVSILLCFVVALAGRAETEKIDTAGAPDAILLDAAGRFSAMERPPVLFRHDRHTDALAAYEKDCTACHLMEDGKMSLKYNRLSDESREHLMSVYHDNCLGCHRSMSEKDQDSGPLTCGECHRESVPRKISRDPMGFDHSLHYRHLKAAQEKCEACHHQYDKTAEKTVYVKGEEGTCRYCHREAKSETGMAFRQAAHLSCISCHRSKMEGGKAAGPVKCRGCHSAAEKRNIIKVADVPRINRGQPDTGFVKRYADGGDVPASAYRMGLTPFDHRRHEAAQNTCRVCHHAALDPCSRCHSIQGTETGNWVGLARAMHHKEETMSCVGCHRAKTHAPQCAGCHAGAAETRGLEEADCRRCHSFSLEVNQDPSEVILDHDRAEKRLSEMRKQTEALDPEKLPETVIIQALEDTYGPVELPHGKIVRALYDSIEDNALASYFHEGVRQVCRGCHHNSPVGEKPPRCISCHGIPFQEDAPLVPGLMAAYHQQCMGCHAKMNMEKPAATDCQACHAEKTKEVQ